MAIETGIDLHTIMTADDGLFATIYDICSALWTERANSRR